MFLLILCSSDCRRTGLSSFTFHDVSINTIRKTKPAKKFHNFTFHDVSINTFFVSPYGIGQAIFTFHDVSINTLNSPHDLSGTSTMDVGMYSSFPVEVTVGGSTIFVLNVDRFEKV